MPLTRAELDLAPGSCRAAPVSAVPAAPTAQQMLPDGVRLVSRTQSGSLPAQGVLRDTSSVSPAAPDTRMETARTPQKFEAALPHGARRGSRRGDARAALGS